MQLNEILLSIIFLIFNFQAFNTLDSTYICLHHQLQNSRKEPAIASRHLLKSISEENQY